MTTKHCYESKKPIKESVNNGIYGFLSFLGIFSNITSFAFQIKKGKEMS